MAVVDVPPQGAEVLAEPRFFPTFGMEAVPHQ